MARQVRLISHNCRDNDVADRELYNVGVDLSSEEEDEVGILSDVSLNEPDYPLHDDALISALYLGHSPMTGAATEQEKRSLTEVSLQVRQKDLQTEEEDVEKADERPEQSIAKLHEDEPLFLSTGGTFKLASKLTKEQRSVSATAVSPYDLQQGNGHNSISSAESATTERSLQRGKEKPDSLTTLSSYFVRGRGSLEAAIVSAIGLEKLTQLGRVGSVRITVGSLEIVPSFAKEILARQPEKKERVGKAGPSNIPLPIHSSRRCDLRTSYEATAMGSQSILLPFL